MRSIKSPVSVKVARGIYDVARELLVERDLAVFLSGGSVKKHDSIRRKLKNGLLSYKYGKERVQVYYPEDLYGPLLLNPRTADLLTLENKLATSVDSVVVVAESYGSICELGAFANASGDLRNRLIAVIDSQHKRDRSFIMGGPVKLLRELPGTHVVYHGFSQPSVDELVRKVVKAVHRLGRNERLDDSTDNPVVAELYTLIAAYVVTPLSQNDLTHMMNSADELGTADAPFNARTGVESLISHGELQKGSAGAYILTSKGEARLRDLLASSSRYKDLLRNIDGYRVNDMNRLLRRCARRPGRVYWNPVRGGVSPSGE